MNRKTKVYIKDGFPNRVVKKNYEVPVYRIFRLKHVYEFLSGGLYKIPQTVAWEDPYENFLAKAKHSIGRNQVSYYDFMPSIYGQCWSMNKETDALWRIYPRIIPASK